MTKCPKHEAKDQRLAYRWRTTYKYVKATPLAADANQAKLLQSLLAKYFNLPDYLSCLTAVYLPFIEWLPLRPGIWCTLLFACASANDLFIVVVLRRTTLLRATLRLLACCDYSKVHHVTCARLSVELGDILVSVNFVHQYFRQMFEIFNN